MISLIKHCCTVDTESLFIIAAALDRQNCILDEKFFELVKLLLLNGGKYLRLRLCFELNGFYAVLF